jgi:pyruvate-formate lyase-activating enzyme
MNSHHKEVQEKLNDVGSGFCLAKWTQTTIHLQMGETHSCHHPNTHKIPIPELARNPSALHNTKFKKEKRKEMLEGKRPGECDYCWNVEDNSDRYSDRVFKSSESWSLPHFDEIKNSNWRTDFNPRYVEVAFSNACNFKCSYCGPSYSSSWVQEAKKFGGYPTLDNFNNLEYLEKTGKMPIHHSEHNPYVEAFWKWWPELYRDLHTFRITGGEPLLSKDTWGVLDYIIEQENPNKNLSIAINSNLGVPDDLIDRFIEKVNRITLEGKVREFIIFTSCDSVGAQAEYIRNGLDYARFTGNVEKIMRNCPRVNITFMVTYNALSVPNYDKFIKQVFDWKVEFASTDRYWPGALLLDTSYLRYPSHQSVKVLPAEFKKNILVQAQLADHLAAPTYTHLLPGYTDLEIQKIKRIYDWFGSYESEESLNKRRYSFYHFFKAHDERRGTDFCKTFPELEEFFHKCSKIKL